ncbi:hypothetical protein chiPu_0031550, partial [Chiloscyllium punctatum]|nr:hypothetical protein [Chiloscyllium punctatum]
TSMLRYSTLRLMIILPSERLDEGAAVLSLQDNSDLIIIGSERTPEAPLMTVPGILAGQKKPS